MLGGGKQIRGNDATRGSMSVEMLVCGVYDRGGRRPGRILVKIVGEEVKT